MDIQSLVNNLANAGSQVSADDRATGERYLKEHENEDGFHVLLQQICSDQSLHQTIRWQASIYFKNSLPKHWKKSSKFPISSQEKLHIQSNAFNHIINDPNKNLISQLALAYAGVCRSAYPNEWPTLFDELVSLIQGSDSLSSTRVFNALLFLNQVIKSMSATRFGSVRNKLLELAPQITMVVGSVYLQTTNTALTELTSQRDSTPEIGNSLAIGYVGLKILNRLINEGYAHPNRVPELEELFPQTLQHFKTFITLYEGNPNDTYLKFVKRYGKMYHQMADRQPVALCLFPDAMAIPEAYLQILESKAHLFYDPSTDVEGNEDTEFWELVCKQGFLLLKRLVNLCAKKSIETKNYKQPEQPPTTSAEAERVRSREESLQLVRILQSFFNLQCQENILTVIFNGYTKLRPRELKAWEEEPEEWFNEDANKDWETDLCGCASRLYIDIVSSFKGASIGTVLSFIEMTTQSDDRFVKDAGLHIFEAGSSALNVYVSFDDMLDKVIFALAREPDPLLRRRICLVTSEWICIGCSKEHRTGIYHMLLSFLNESDSSNDLVVMLNAVTALRYTVDDWKFEPEDFMPFLKDFLTKLCIIMSATANVDTKLAILTCISVIVERLDRLIGPHIETVLSLLPSLWEDAQDKPLVLGTISQVLKNLVVSAGDASIHFHNFILPVLRASIDPMSPMQMYLYDDGLELWLAVLANAPDGEDHQLNELLPYLIDLFNNQTESVEQGLNVLDSYLLLSGKEVVCNYGGSIFQNFAAYIPDMQVQALTVLAKTLELIPMVSSFNDYWQFSVPCVEAIISYVLEPNGSGIASSRLLKFVARAAWADASSLLQLLGDRAGRFVDCWFDRFESIGDPRDRKLYALGLTALLRSGTEALMMKLPKEFVNVWCELLDEVNEDNGDSTVYYSADDFNNEDHPTPEQLRQKNLRLHDPVHTVKLKDYIRDVLRDVQGISVQHAEFVNSINPEILQLLGNILKPRQ